MGCSGFDETNSAPEWRFCLVPIGKGYTGQRVIEVLEKMVVGWREVWGVS